MKDLKKKFEDKTRDGYEVLAIFHYPNNMAGSRLIAHLKNDDGYVYVNDFYEDGRTSKDREGPRDLIPTPVKKTVWINVYHDNHEIISTIHVSREFADSDNNRRKHPNSMTNSRGRVSCIEHTYTIPQ